MKHQNPLQELLHVKALCWTACLDGGPAEGYFLQWVFSVPRDHCGHQNRWLEADFGDKTDKTESLGAQVEE